MQVERRRSPRYSFIASAEITDERENARITSNISDLSLEGCYVELPNPFPQGTAVMLEIYTDEDFMETHATVAFHEPKLGMGLHFNDMQPRFAGILSKWLAKAELKKPLKAKQTH